MQISIIVTDEAVTGPQAAVDRYTYRARAGGLNAEEILEDLAAQGLLAAGVPLHASDEDGRLTVVVGC